MHLNSMRFSFITVLASLAFCSNAWAGPTYVIKEPGGVIRFTNKQPPKGTAYEIFTAKNAAFTVVRGSKGYKGKLYKNIFDEIIREASKKRGLDEALIRAVIHTESGFNPRAVSPKGARGLMQLMPATARELGVTNSFDPQQNIHGGSRYLAEMLTRYSGNLKKALAAYNAGPTIVDQFGGVPPYTETIDYIGRVIELMKRYHPNRLS